MSVSRGAIVAMNNGVARRRRRRAALAAELVVNGDFSSDAGWMNSSSGTGTAVIAGGVLTVMRVDSANKGSMRQQITGLVPGATYRVSGMSSGATAFVSFGNQSGNQPSGMFQFDAVATATQALMYLECALNGGTAVFDNMSVKRIL